MHQGKCAHASIQNTGDVDAQSIEKSALNATNSRTVEIFTDGDPAILSGTDVTPLDPGTPKRRSLRVVKQLTNLDQAGKRGQAVSA
jgi:hypothetical protein